MCCAPSAVFRTQGVAAGGIDKGNALWSGRWRLLSLVFILTQHKVKKAACDRREDWCAEYTPPPPFFLLVLLPPLGISDGQGFHRASRDWFPPPLQPRDRACFSHRVIWDFQRGSGGDGEGEGGMGRYCAGAVGLVLVEMTGWWCGDRQDWLELRKKWKTETEMEKLAAGSLRLKGFAALLHSNHPGAQRLLADRLLFASGQVVLRRIDPPSSNADWY